MEEIKMYATCTNQDGVMLALKNGVEYRILKVDKFYGFGDLFFLLEDDKWYASCHFSVTYLK